MRVLYDHQIFDKQKIGGISRYFSEIVRNAPEGMDPEISIAYSDNEYLHGILPAESVKGLYDPRYTFLRGIEFRGKGRLFRALRRMNPEAYQSPYDFNRKSTIAALEAQNFDVFHPTFFDDYFLEHLGNKPFVITIHDMIPEIFPEFYVTRSSLRTTRSKERLAKRADHIIAVSENTKRDICTYYEIEESKISVIYHGTHLDGSRKEKESRGKYILYIGDRVAGYKNFLFLLRAIGPILLEDPDIYLLCSGPDFTTNELEYMKILEIESKVKSNFIPDDTIGGVFSEALCLVLPSYYEGFGIPILEALACSCPLAISDIEVFREIAGEAALYFNPKDVHEIRGQIRHLCTRPDLREELAAKGLERLNKFSWERTAKRTFEVYKNLMH
jgi:glycosyltransferase involved in cell wall biosynthesis